MNSENYNGALCFFILAPFLGFGLMNLTVVLLWLIVWLMQ